MRMRTLPIPKVATTEHTGLVMRVIGLCKKDNQFILNTATQENTREDWLLPKSLEPWASHTLYIINTGINFFPEDIEFGELPDKHVYAEIK